MKLDYPILYCCYNRPELVKKSLNILKELKPKKFYIACDGPKSNDLDIKKCKEVRDLIKNANFLSNTEYKFNDKNLGCKKSISQSIDWFFNNEEEGVIIEDDIMASKDFFKFCDYALLKYKNNEKIMMVSGTNYLGEKIESNKYFFSEHFIIWGWATWKRAWKHYDVNMRDWKDEKVIMQIKDRFNKKTFEFLKNRFNQIFLDYKDTWDIQWYFACIKNKGLCVVPEANLIKNIGIEGTHSKKFYKTLLLQYGKIDYRSLEAPLKVEANIDFDNKIHEKFHFKNKYIKKLKYLIKLILKKF